MNSVLRAAVWIVWVGAGLGVQAEVRLPADSPYQAILDRNPFGLRPPPTNVVQAVTSAPPVEVNVNLSGITFYAGVKRAWMVIPAGGTRTNTTTFSMAEGDPEFEGIGVERIDVERGVVHIRKGGVASTLDFENHGLAYTGPVVKTPAGARAGAGQVQVPRANAVRPTRARSATAVPVANPAARINTPQSAVAAPQAASGFRPGQRVIPSRAIRAAQPREPVDPAVQLIQLNAQKIMAQQQGSGFPPLPPALDLGPAGGPGVGQ